MTLQITDHAMVRYLERIAGVDTLISETFEMFGRVDDHLILDMAELKHGLTRKELAKEITTPLLTRFADVIRSGRLHTGNVSYVTKDSRLVTIHRRKEFDYGHRLN